MDLTAITPKNFNPAKAGNFLFLSGQVPLDDLGRMVGFRDIRAQTRQVFENIKVILEEAGTSLDKIVRWNGYIVNMDKNYTGFAEVRAQYFPKDPKPTATLVEVLSLAHVEAIAVVD